MHTAYVRATVMPSSLGCYVCSYWRSGAAILGKLIPLEGDCVLSPSWLDNRSEDVTNKK